MFEKEAIRHAFEDTIGVECLIKPVEDFTYEELSDEQQEKAYDFKKGAEFGYIKANEWHYVKDKLPPIKKEYNGRSELVLVLSKEKEMQYAQYVEKEKTWARGICEINFKPYAWREIKLPEPGLQMPMQEG